MSPFYTDLNCSFVNLRAFCVPCSFFTSLSNHSLKEQTNKQKISKTYTHANIHRPFHKTAKKINRWLTNFIHVFALSISIIPFISFFSMFLFSPFSTFHPILVHFLHSLSLSLSLSIHHFIVDSIHFCWSCLHFTIHNWIWRKKVLFY